MKMRFLVAALAILISANISSASTEISDALSNDRITAITQDMQGHIWIGTFRGLNKFDSHAYHQYFCGTDEPNALPDNQIRCLHTDVSGRLWVGTVNGICRYRDDDSFETIPAYGIQSKNVGQILETRSGKLLINTSDAISLYKPESDCFESIITVYSRALKYITAAYVSPDDRLWILGDRLYCFDTGNFHMLNSYLLPQEELLSACMTPDGSIWMSFEDGMYLFSVARESFVALPESMTGSAALSSTPITQMYLCSGNLLLLSDNSDAFAYNFGDGTLTRQSDPDFEFSIPDFIISNVFEDRDKNIWWCSYDQGYKVSYAYKERFGNHSLNTALSGRSVISLELSDHDRLFIATLRDGIFTYKLSDGSFSGTPLRIGGKEYRNPYITDMEAQEGSYLWIATYKNVFLTRVSDKELTVLHTWDVPMCLCLKGDDEGYVWAATNYGKILRLGRDGSVQAVDLHISPESYSFVGGIDLLPSGNVIVSTFRNGLYEIDRNILSAGHIDFSEEEWSRCIARSLFIPSAICVDSKGMVWLGTVANGLLRYDPASGRLQPVPGTPCDDICSIEEDQQGNLWISTQHGLAKYDRTVGRFINWFKSDGIGGNQFYDRASCKTKKGALIFGGTHGITLFDPLVLMEKRNVPLVFEALKVNNCYIKPGDGKSISKAMNFNPPVKLKYDEDSFGIAFTALDYSEFDRVRYAYKLEGYDRFWIDATGSREALYTNVPAGKYSFKVRISNMDRTEILAENSLDITIERPFWRSWWAYLLYLSIAICIILTIVSSRRRLSLEKQAREKASMEREQEKRMNEMNMSFFANISHEFRTPLTMIAAPVAQLSESFSIDGEGRRLLDIVRRNINRMLRLVNQLLDFNKMENDSLKLKVRKVDVVALLRYMVDTFKVNAEEKGISLVSWGIEDSLTAWIDDDKIDKICFNLLSNAMKFTSQGGKIEISLDCLTREEASRLFKLGEKDTDTRYVKITVKDSGPGIPEDQLEKIFERYYQLDNNVRGAYNWGTGIGLYYARSLATIHHGWLQAANRSDMRGAEFTLLVPASESSYAEEEKGREEGGIFVKQEALQCHGFADETPADDSKHSVLVVDDDTEIVRYMRELLSAQYNVIYKYDADSAFNAIKKDAPDIVISDVVMPGKTGYELCRDIKGSLQLSHIPVILLTAKANVDDQVEGLDCGADAYVTKPFEPQYLLALVNSQIKNREKIKSMLSQATEVASLEENVLSEQDNAFMKELYELMEAELSNDELDVSGMTERLHISRTKFYYKVKGLTGENPSVFFKRYKLNRAAQFLRDRKYNISEVADMTGFSTLSHFSTSFKKQFGVSPSDYLK